MNAFGTKTVHTLNGNFSITPTESRGAVVTRTLATSYTLTRDQLFTLVSTLIGLHGEDFAKSMAVSLAIAHKVDVEHISIAMRAAYAGDAAYFAKQGK